MPGRAGGRLRSSMPFVASAPTCPSPHRSDENIQNNTVFLKPGQRRSAAACRPHRAVARCRRAGAQRRQPGSRGAEARPARVGGLPRWAGSSRLAGDRPGRDAGGAEPQAGVAAKPGPAGAPRAAGTAAGRGAYPSTGHSVIRRRRRTVVGRPGHPVHRTYPRGLCHGAPQTDAGADRVRLLRPVLLPDGGHGRPGPCRRHRSRAQDPGHPERHRRGQFHRASLRLGSRAAIAGGAARCHLDRHGWAAHCRQTPGCAHPRLRLPAPAGPWRSPAARGRWAFAKRAARTGRAAWRGRGRAFRRLSAAQRPLPPGHGRVRAHQRIRGDAPGGAGGFGHGPARGCLTRRRPA